jgi:hypothetical protein
MATRAAEPAVPPEGEHLHLLRRIAAAAERQAEALERLEARAVVVDRHCFGSTAGQG